MITRRSLLIGAGALLTSAFVKEARTYALDTDSPLLLTPSKRKETLYFHPWEAFDSTAARSFELLKDKRLFPRDSSLKRAGSLAFEQYPNPTSSARWVEAKDALTLSLLQARLCELDLGVSLAELPYDF